jgi:hypothetical protein
MNFKTPIFAILLWAILYWVITSMPLPADALKLMPYLPTFILVMLIITIFGFIVEAVFNSMGQKVHQRLEVIVPIPTTKAEIAAVLLDHDDKVIYEYLIKTGKITQTDAGVKIIWEGKPCYHANTFRLNGQTYHPKIIWVIELDNSPF